MSVPPRTTRPGDYPLRGAPAKFRVPLWGCALSVFVLGFAFTCGVVLALNLLGVL